MAINESLGSLSVSIDPKFKAYDAALSRAQRQFDKLGSNLDRRSESIANRMVSGFARMGAAVGGALAVIGGVRSIGNAIGGVADLESAFANLRKVTGDTFPTIRDQIEQLSLSMRGVSVGDLATLATEGAKLGVADADLAKFTEHLAMMRIAMDDIDTQELATQTARILNVFGTSVTKAGEFGSALNKLSDTSAASAGEILDVTRRLSGTASVLGMTEQQTMALATAMLEAGIGVEVGGTAMSQILGKLATDTEKFAGVAGMSVGQFEALLRKDAVGALTAFEKGMNRFDSLAQFKVLGDLGIEGERAKASVLQLNRTIDRIPKMTALADAEKSMASLAKEVDIRGETLSARFTQMGNQIQVMGQMLNRALGPVIGPVLDAMGSRFAAMGNWVRANAAAIQSWSASGMAAFTAFNARIQQAFSNLSSSITTGIADLFGYTDATTMMGDAWSWVGTVWGIAVGRLSEFGSMMAGLATSIADQAAQLIGYSDAVSVATDIWGALKSVATGAIETLGAMTRNWSLIVEEATVRAMAWGQNIVTAAKWAGSAFGAFLTWLRGNWSNILTDMGANFLTWIQNIGANLKKFGAAFWEFMKSGFDTSKFNPDFTALTEGFRSTVGQFPAIAAPVWANVQGDIDAIRERMAAQELTALEGRNLIAQTIEQAAEPGAAELDDEGMPKRPAGATDEEGAAPAGHESYGNGRVAQQAAFMDAAAFAQRIQAGALSRQDRQGELVANGQQQVRVLTRMEILLQQLAKKQATGRRIMV